MHELARSIGWLVQQGYPSKDKEGQDDLALVFFCQSISKALSQKIENRGCRTLHEALKIAQVYDGRAGYHQSEGERLQDLWTSLEDTVRQCKDDQANLNAQLRRRNQDPPTAPPAKKQKWKTEQVRQVQTDWSQHANNRRQPAKHQWQRPAPSTQQLIEMPEQKPIQLPDLSRPPPSVSTAARG